MPTPTASTVAVARRARRPGDAPRISAFVAVLGPPAVGKTTLTAGLAERGGATVFRLREFLDQQRQRPGVDPRLFATRDPLGWLAEDSVALLARTAFLHGRFAAAGPVLLENFPGSLPQLRLLHRIAGQLAAPLAVLELRAPDHVLAHRACWRRVCPVCEPGPRGDPHRPATPADEDRDRCGACGGRLATRPSDRAEVFTARLARFRRRIGAIHREAGTLGLPWHSVDAATDPLTCLHRAADAAASNLAAPRRPLAPPHAH